MRTAVALSGGIDSAVAAHILKQQGNDVVALTMTLVAAEAQSRAEAAPLAAASRAAALLGIDHHVVDASEGFRRAVIEPFLREYSSGRTPNPCIICNEFVKFGLLMEEADALGATLLATGHHARIAAAPGGPYIERAATGEAPRLLRGADRAKDQSYFLYRLSAEQLSRSVMPVGELTKSRVRELAEEIDFARFAGRESADICFAGGGLPDFIRSNAPWLLEPGPVEDVDGNVVGQHDGIALYTIGQRSGLGVALGMPVYVVRIDAARRAVVLGPESDLMALSLDACALAWPTGHPPAREFEADAQVRYAATPAACRVTIDGEVARVVFANPQRAIAPGQSVVFYDGDIVLGGGIIERAGGTE